MSENETPSDVANVTPIGKALSDDDLRGISDFHEAVDLLAQRGLAVESYADYGTGFDILEAEQKDSLVNRAFVILSYSFNKSARYKDDAGNAAVFVSMEIVTDTNQKLIVNDGSTGIRKQMESLRDARERNNVDQRRPLLVANGLRRSTYETNVGDKVIQGVTYYLSH